MDGLLGPWPVLEGGGREGRGGGRRARHALVLWRDCLPGRRGGDGVESEMRESKEGTTIHSCKHNHKTSYVMFVDTLL